MFDAMTPWLKSLPIQISRLVTSCSPSPSNHWATMAAETKFLRLMMQAISTPEVGKLLEHDFKTSYDEFLTALAPLFEALGDLQPVAAASLYLAILDGAMLQSLVGATLFDQEQILTQMKERLGF